MARWRKQVDLTKATDKYDSDLSRYGEAKAVELTRDRILKLIDKELKEVPGSVKGAFKRAKTERGLNSALDKLYDWADISLVWVQNF